MVTNKYKNSLVFIHSNAMYVGLLCKKEVNIIELSNWKTQIRKGYLELCVLALINSHKKLYGFDLIDKLKNLGLQIKEGTLYPLLNRMTKEGVLTSYWETEGNKGHPRKFYSLNKKGIKSLSSMTEEFQSLIDTFKKI
jgi:PadR family transcriptional regulator, regulatory protein PadR